MKIHKKGNWEYWYDPSLKCWYAMKTDSEGNQIGDCLNAYDKTGILYAINLEDPKPLEVFTGDCFGGKIEYPDRIKITPTEGMIIKHRLEAPDCIAECLEAETDHVESICAFLIHQIDQGFIQFSKLDGVYSDLTERAVLEEALRGSTWFVCAKQAEEFNEITRQKATAFQSAGDRLEEKFKLTIPRD